MKSSLTTLLTCILVSACGNEPTEPEFFEAVSDVLLEFETRGVFFDKTVPIRFDDDLDSAGRCEIRFGTNIILINRFHWENRTDRIRRKYLIAHEIGHCMLGLDHNEKKETTSARSIPVPVSLMFPDSSVAAGSVDEVPELNEYYFDELLGVEQPIESYLQ